MKGEGVWKGVAAMKSGRSEDVSGSSEQTGGRREIQIRCGGPAADDQ